MLQILDYPWHQVHSYRLHALPAEFTYLMTRPLLWNIAQRPIPDNWLGGLEPQDVQATDYHLALMHLDQWCDGRHNLRALPYRIMNIIARNIPRVIIMHGTPDNEQNRQAILRLIGDLPVVCNSSEAARAWDSGEQREDCYGLPQFRAIIHGYTVREFNGHNNDRQGIITICSGGRWSRLYHGIPMLERLIRDIPIAWYGPSGNREWLKDYRAYRDLLEHSLVYFSPTRHAPMPGSRTEAMLSGCCIVTVPGNDVEQYITHGQTGLVVNNYEQARDTLRALLQSPDTAMEIGQRGREAARKYFAHGRFVKDWLSLLEEIGVR